MKKLLLLILCLCLALSAFTACKKDSDESEGTTESSNTGETSQFEGSWVATINFAEAIDEGIDAEVKYHLTFTGDQFSMNVNKDDALAAVDAIIEYLADSAEEMGTTFEETVGMSLENYKASLLATLETESYSESGSWSLNGSTITLGEGAYEIKILSDTEIILTQNGTSYTFRKQ